jgi:hypothetical protein
MKAIRLLAITFLGLLCSCTDTMHSCFLRKYPEVTLVGFDSTEIDTVTIKTFDVSKGMDSLIETKKINMLTTSFHSNFDSFQLSRFFYSDTHLYYGANSNYKFNIQFGINRELEIYNFIYDDGKECDSYGRGAYGVECWCPYINCDVNTTNCKKLNTKQLYISPQ